MGPGHAAQAGGCPGCGVVLPSAGWEAPPHIHASPGCWAAYGEVLAREYGEWANPPVHRLTVDTYSAQHPGDPSRRSTHAMAAHLIGLYLWLERGVEAGRIAREAGRVSARPSEFEWLEPPSGGSGLTIIDVKEAETLRDHTSRVERWAQSVWEAWSDHHDTVRRWAGR
jgi:hypothetical protein